MKKIILSLVSVFISFSVFSQNLEETLSEKIKQLETTHKSADLQRLANDFERLALADVTNWLSNYYTAYTYVRLADQSEGNQIDRYCDAAEKYLKIAEKLNSDKSEIYALYAYLYSARVKVSPMFRGAKMGKQSKEYALKSIEANSKNPRPYLIRAIGIFYTPKVFGGGAEKASPLLNDALTRFETFTPATPNSPKWGKGMADFLKKEMEK